MSAVNDLLNTVAFTLFGAPTTVAEIVGFISGAICVWLCVTRSIWNFPVGIINAIFFAYLFFGAGLYADMSLQFMFMGFCVFGWYVWLRRGPGGGPLSQVTMASWRLRLITIIGMVLLVAALVPILRSVGGSAPFWDASVFALSVGAQFLLCFKKIDNWALWIVCDLISIPLYISKGLMLTAGVYAIFLVMVLIGLYMWRRQMLADAPADDRVPAGAAIA